MRNSILLIASIAIVATSAYAYSTGDWLCGSGACTLGASTITGVTTTTDGSSLNLEGTNANTLTLTAAAAGTAIFEGADAATPANTIFTTTGEGTVTVGDASVTAVIGTTDGASLNLAGTATDELNLFATGANTAVFRGADATGAADTIFTTTGAGTVTIGDSNVTAVTVTTDGGSVTIDGTIAVTPNAVVVVGGGETLTVNTVHIATAAADYDLPACASATGDWVTLIAQDASEVLSLTPNSGGTIFAPGVSTTLDADDELDSAGTADDAGDFITVICGAANSWYSIAMGGVWTDGGVP